MNTKEFKNKDYEVTKELQNLIDKAKKEGKKLTISKGRYITGPLFLPSDFHLHFERGSILKGSIKESEYPLINTRIAGITMDGFPAILNIIDKENVKVTGKGIIDGSGKFWYDKYYGSDTLGGMRALYDKEGLRAFCDYDCMRPRNILIQNSNNIILDGITSFESGFWNIHILYSKDIKLINVKVKVETKHAPSTDGIDIDSSCDVLIYKSILSSDDDNISIKSGRGIDGINIGRPSNNIKIDKCKFLKGYGVTVGSEVSGGVSDIFVSNSKFIGTDCGFRIKTQEDRKGYIKNIYLDNLKMENVKYTFRMDSLWHPQYNAKEIPSKYLNIAKPYWHLISKDVPKDIPNTIIEGIYCNNLKSVYKEDYTGISRAFDITGFKDFPINGIYINDSYISSKEYGRVINVLNFETNNTIILTKEENDSKNDEFDNR